MSTDFVRLTSVKTANTIHVIPLHIVGVTIDPYYGEGTVVLTTPGVIYLVEESPEEVERRVTEILNGH